MPYDATLKIRTTRVSVKLKTFALTLRGLGLRNVWLSEKIAIDSQLNTAQASSVTIPTVRSLCPAVIANPRSSKRMRSLVTAEQESLFSLETGILLAAAPEAPPASRSGYDQPKQIALEFQSGGLLSSGRARAIAL